MKSIESMIYLVLMTALLGAYPSFSFFCQLISNLQKKALWKSFFAFWKCFHILFISVGFGFSAVVSYSLYKSMEAGKERHTEVVYHAEAEYDSSDVWIKGRITLQTIQSHWNWNAFLPRIGFTTTHNYLHIKLKIVPSIDKIDRNKRLISTTIRILRANSILYYQQSEQGLENLKTWIWDIISNVVKCLHFNVVFWMCMCNI